MKAYKESSGIAPRILNFCVRYKLVASFRPGRLNVGERAPSTYEAEGRVGPEQARNLRNREKFFAPVEN
jgi:hypothetical protein